MKTVPPVGSHQCENHATRAPADGGSPQLAVLDLSIAPTRIHYLKFILEGYDGLAGLSTLDPRQGLVRLRFPVEVKEEVLTLLRGLEAQIGGIDWLNVVREQSHV